MNASESLPSPAWTGTAYDSFDDPLSGSRRSFRSVSELSGVSSGPTSPWSQNEASMTVSNQYSRYEIINGRLSPEPFVLEQNVIFMTPLKIENARG